MRRSAPLVAAAALAIAAAPAAASVRITSAPALWPSFSRKVPDYVARCSPGKPLRVSVKASKKDRVAVARKKGRGGDFERDVDRAPDAAFTIRVRSGGRTTTHHVRCLPADFPAYAFESHGAAQAQFYVIDPTGAHVNGYLAIFDRRGVPLWWRDSSSFGPWDGKLLPDGTIAFARWYGDHFGVRDKDAYEVRRLDGTLVRLVRTAGTPTDTHDLQMLPNGHYLALSYRRRCCDDLSSHGGPKHAEVFDNEIQELTPGGTVVWRWNTKNHVPLSWITGGHKQSGWWYQEITGTPDRPATENAYDVVHLNSVEPDGDGLIVSSRHTDSVFRIDRATGRIDWKLGGTHVKGKSLRLLGPHPTPLFGGQHDARLWKDGSLTVHDNGSWQDRPPTADRFEIDRKARTARLVERVASPGLPNSKAIGSARKLAAGDWVVSWGGFPVVTEQDESGAIVRRFTFADNHWSYRAVPLEPGRLSARALRRGMDRMTAANRTAPR